MLPFSREQFFELFAAYNSATWPAAVVAYPLALAALLAAWRAGPRAGRIVAAVLALMWGWVGIAYHGLHFAAINPAARLFAAAFVIQAALFAWHAWNGRGLAFGARSPLRAVSGGAMFVYSLVLYPAIGLAAGERYPALPLFGVAPCPLLIFTFGLMVWATLARWWLWIVPLLWSLVGGSAAVLLAVPQDWALPLSALLVLGVAWFDRSGRRTAEPRPGG